MNTRKNQFLFFVGAIILAFFTWIFLWPRIGQVWTAREKLEEEKGRLAKLQEKVRILQGLDETVLTGRVKITIQAVPPEKNFLEVLGILNQKAAENNLIMDNLKVTPGALTFDQKGKLNVKFSAEGRTEDLQNFLEATKKLFPLVTATGSRIVFTPPGETAKGDLTVEFYYQPLPKTLGPVDAPVEKLNDQEEKFLSKLSEFTAPEEIVIPLPAGKANPFTF